MYFISFGRSKIEKICNSSFKFGNRCRTSELVESFENIRVQLFIRRYRHVYIISKFHDVYCLPLLGLISWGHGRLPFMTVLCDHEYLCGIREKIRLIHAFQRDEKVAAV